jgi:hypothetical protein
VPRSLRDLFRRRPRRTDDAEIRAEYAPDLDGDPDPGEVVWTWVPYEDDPSKGKDRPVAVIGHRRRALVGVPLTSQHDPRRPQFELGIGDWDPQHRPSYAKIDRVIDLDPSRMRREGSVIDRARFERLVDAVDRYHDLERAD